MKAKQIPKRVELVAQVLRFVNTLRVESGLHPLTQMPKGIRYSETQCPIARGINHDASVGGSRIRVKDATIASMFGRGVAKHGVRDGVRRGRVGVWTIYMPKFATEFVNSFDAGRIPQLIGY